MTLSPAGFLCRIAARACYHALNNYGGFWVLEATDMNEALEWGRKAVVACRAPVEVRQFHSL